MNLGWRGRIGFISPGRGTIHGSFQEMVQVAPDGVLIRPAFLDGPDSLSVDDLRALRPAIPKAAEELASISDMDLVLMGGAPICLANEPDELVDEIQAASGLPATTVLHGLVNGLRRLDSNRVVLFTPYYEKDLAHQVAEYMTGQGFEILSVTAGDDVEFGTQQDISPYRTHRRAKKAVKAAGAQADALLLVGGGTPTGAILEPLEEDIRMPVVTNNFASLWNALDMIDVRRPIHGYGVLMTCL